MPRYSLTFSLRNQYALDNFASTLQKNSENVPIYLTILDCLHGINPFFHPFQINKKFKSQSTAIPPPFNKKRALKAEISGPTYSSKPLYSQPLADQQQVKGLNTSNASDLSVSNAMYGKNHSQLNKVSEKVIRKFTSNSSYSSPTFFTCLRSTYIITSHQAIHNSLRNIN